MEKQLAYLFDEDFVDKYLVVDLPVTKEYYVDEGFYVCEGGEVIHACPECGELVEEAVLLRIASYIPETESNLAVLERQGIDLDEDMLLEALDCYAAHLGELELAPFSAELYLADLDAVQYVVDFGFRKGTFDVVERVEVVLLEEQDDVRTYQMGEQVVVTKLWRVVSEK